jgi:hypothetical protein
LNTQIWAFGWQASVFEGDWNKQFLLRHASESAYSIIQLVLILGAYTRFVITKDMPFYCVAANCTNKACLKHAKN